MKILATSSFLLALTLAAALPVDQTNSVEVEQLTPVPEPAFNAQRDVRFLLFSRLNPTVGQQLVFRDVNTLRSSNYNVNLPTRVIIHGFQNDATSDVNILLTAAFLRSSDVNVVVGEFLEIFKKVAKI